MTVQELIEELNKVEKKDAQVYFYHQNIARDYSIINHVVDNDGEVELVTHFP